MNWQLFLKAMTVFRMVTNAIPSAVAAASHPSEVRAIVANAVTSDISSLITSGHLPPDFTKGLGNMVTDILQVHPDVSNIPVPIEVAPHVAAAIAASAPIPVGVSAVDVEAMISKNNSALIDLMAARFDKPSPSLDPGGTH